VFTGVAPAGSRILGASLLVQGPKLVLFFHERIQLSSQGV